MNRGVQLLICLGLAVAGCGGAGESNGEPAEASPEGAVGAAPAEAPELADPAPDFDLPDLAGNRVTMASLRGKTVVIDFWATWCPPCIFQIPILNSVQARHAANGVAVIGVAVDVEGAEVVKPYAEENDIQYTVLLGDEGLARKFGAPGFPALVIVAPNGNIDSRHVGLIEEADLDEALAAVPKG